VGVLPDSVTAPGGGHALAVHLGGGGALAEQRALFRAGTALVGCWELGVRLLSTTRSQKKQLVALLVLVLGAHLPV
jgi:hypothetical protein